jgi:NitT/TauT family transport system ATP-binding protein
MLVLQREISMNDNMIKHDFKVSILNLGKKFDRKKSLNAFTEDFFALRHFNLNIVDGEFITVLGPSGCGKSTFLDIVAGLSKPTEGIIAIDGKNITGPAMDRGVVFQGYALLPWRTVRQNVEYGLQIKGIPKAERKKISDAYINLVGLEPFSENYPHELSGGMKQRVAIARTLAFDPTVLLMDEPFAAVDAQTRETLQDELLNIWERTGKTVIFVTHSIDEAIFLGDRAVVMSAGPGAIKQIFDVDLARPRTPELRNGKDFAKLRAQIGASLYNDRLENYGFGNSV